MISLIMVNDATFFCDILNVFEMFSGNFRFHIFRKRSFVVLLNAEAKKWKFVEVSVFTSLLQGPNGFNMSSKRKLMFTHFQELRC